MALTDQALTTVARVQAVPGMSNVSAAVLEPYIEAASAEFVGLVGRAIHYQASITEAVMGFGRARLTVRDAVPIVSVTSITYTNGTTSSTVSASNYEIEDSELGWIRYIGGNWSFTGRHSQDITTTPLAGTEERLYRVIYTGGYITPNQEDGGSGTRNLPFDIEQAVVDYIISLYFGAGRDKSQVSKSTARGNVSFANNGAVPGLPMGFARVAERYRLP